MTDADLRKMLEDEWHKHKPPIPMGERRLSLAVAAMRRAFEAGREDAMHEMDAAGFQQVP